MKKQVLITGGAGFVGSHVADELLSHGYPVRALDSLIPQVHGAGCVRPSYLNPEVELVIGDVRDAAMVRRALDGIDVVYHFAAAVGVGQSMYEITQYTSVNNLGTAVLLEALPKSKVQRLIVASSMSIYGEGLYQDPSGETAVAPQRSVKQLRAADWELRTPDGQPLKPVATPEWKPPELASIYALSKYDQERMCLMISAAYGVEVVALRFFNIYGPRQALSNPYTGVLAIFASRLLNGKPPLIFEDGCQLRDFVNVADIKRACRLALEVPEASGGVFNIGSGCSYRIRDIAEQMARVLGYEELLPRITGQYRVGDIRHCFSDIRLAREVLGFEPRITLANGIRELASWLDGRTAEDRVAEACSELTARGLTV
jgi:dTDP-L-rhamnose 4-epimerase